MIGRSAAAMILAASLGGCAAGGGDYDLMDMQRRLDNRGMSFGLTRGDSRNAVLLQMRFRTSEAGGDEPAPDFRAAAEAAAPPGCHLQSLTPAGEATMQARYSC